MNKTDRAEALINLEEFVEKAGYLSANIIERYDLDSGMVKSYQEALMFANNRENIGMEMEILCDYIRNIQATIAELRETVAV